MPKIKNGQSPIKHRIPSLGCDNIGFCYSNFVAYFSIPDYVTYIHVTMERLGGEIFSSDIYTANPVWNITLPSGEYYVKCDADEGSHFEGVVYID